MTYCGLCCYDCHGYTGMIADIARDLRKELRGAQYDKFAAAIADAPFGETFAYYDKCYGPLGAVVKFRCKKGCRDGGVLRSAQSGSAAKKKKQLRGAGNAAKQKRVNGWTFSNLSMEMHT